MEQKWVLLSLQGEAQKEVWLLSLSPGFLFEGKLYKISGSRIF